MFSNIVSYIVIAVVIAYQTYSLTEKLDKVEEHLAILLKAVQHTDSTTQDIHRVLSVHHDDVKILSHLLDEKEAKKLEQPVPKTSRKK